MIKENVKKILSELPSGVELVAAAKGRKSEEVMEAIKAGVKIEKLLTIPPLGRGNFHEGV